MAISWNTALRTVAAVTLAVLGVLFFRSTSGDLAAGYAQLKAANNAYLALCGALAAIYAALQGQTLRLAYQAVGHNIPLLRCTALYLKRFFLSPFIPGGFSVAQYTLTRDLRKYETTAPENTFASTVFVLRGQASYIIILTLTLILAVQGSDIQASKFYAGLLLLASGVIALGLIALVFRREILKYVRTWLKPHIGHFHLAPIVHSILLSTVADALGILVLWSALRSVGLGVTIGTAAIGYVVTILITTISPLFQGLVVVEGALIYTLSELGYDPSASFAGAIVFRSFQLWIPLIVGGMLYILPNALRWLHSLPSKLLRS